MMSVIVSRLTLGNEKKIRTQEVIGSDECMVFLPSPPREKKNAIEKKEETKQEVVAVQAEAFSDYDENAKGKEVGVLNSRNDFDFDGLTDHEVRILDLVT